MGWGLYNLRMPLSAGSTLINKKYTVNQHLGSGGFADVYLATHNDLGYQRAIKVLNPANAGLGTQDAAEWERRFLLEAKLGNAIDNPHVVKVFDFERADDEFFLVMEYCSGGSLKERLYPDGSPQPLSEADTIVLAQQLCAGLAAIHTKGAVHRDVKPSNILFAADGTAKIADLGLAQESMGQSQPSGSLALAHPGTPEYMSPEQEQTTAYLTAASDAYSLGCVLFECLTGKLYKTVKGDVVSDFVTVSPALDSLIERLLEPHVAQRKADDSDFHKRFRKIAFVMAALDDLNTAEQELKKAALDAEKARQAKLAAEKEAAARAEQQAREQAEQARRAEKQRQQRAAAKKAEQERLALAAEQERQRKAAVEKARRANPAGIEWVDIPAGDFLYGDNKETRTIERAYKIGKTPVTNAQYKKFIDAHPKQPVPEHWDSNKRTFRTGHANKPVVYVSWEDAQLFCKWANCRLPSELEWKKAARGTDGRKYPWGNEPPKKEKSGLFRTQQGHCNFHRGSDFKNGDILTNVGYFTPKGDSPYGCQDIAGNVWDWCEDWVDNQKRYRVLRGGSWRNYETLVRCARRSRSTPTSRSDYVGFRVALLLNF